MSHLSHSQLTSWVRCAKAYFLERKAHAPSVPAVYLSAGVAVHEVIERLTLAHADAAPKITDLKAEWDKTFTDAVAKETSRTGISPDQWRTAGRKTKDKPHGEDIDWWRENGLTQCEGYADWLSKVEWDLAVVNGQPGAEIPFEVDLHGTVVKGFIDSLWTDRSTDAWLCIDAKTGSRTPDSMLQMGLYATAIEVMTGKRPTMGGFYMTRSASVTPLEDLRRFDIDFWGAVFSQLNEAVSKEIYIPNLGSHCRSCSVRDACYAAGGVDAYRYDPLHPQHLRHSKNTTNTEEVQQ